jgi:hypothetical protein
MEPLDQRRPVTFGLIVLLVAVVTVCWPVVSFAHSLTNRIVALETEKVLRGAQLDRIESDVKELLRRSK